MSIYMNSYWLSAIFFPGEEYHIMNLLPISKQVPLSISAWLHAILCCRQWDVQDFNDTDFVLSINHSPCLVTPSPSNTVFMAITGITKGISKIVDIKIIIFMLSFTPMTNSDSVICESNYPETESESRHRHPTPAESKSTSFSLNPNPTALNSNPDSNPAGHWKPHVIRKGTWSATLEVPFFSASSALLEVFTSFAHFLHWIWTSSLLQLHDSQNAAWPPFQHKDVGFKCPDS